MRFQPITIRLFNNHLQQRVRRENNPLSLRKKKNVPQLMLQRLNKRKRLKFKTKQLMMMAEKRVTERLILIKEMIRLTRSISARHS
jgi:hypothetical protein